MTPRRAAATTTSPYTAGVVVTGLHKRFGAAQALDGVSFTVRPGVVTGFVGPNGAGKPNIGH
jgi:ABC-type multidrug transport system ATPase subunit